MLKKFTNLDKRTELEKEIDKQISILASEAKTPDEIQGVMDLMSKRQQLGKKQTVSPDTLAIVAGNLLGIVLILGYEKANIITTKALGFILKGRV